MISSFSSFSLSAQLSNVITGLGLRECTSTPIGDGAIRGISGGQKRRVTLGEMLLPPRSIKYMDEISNGLDSATAYDLIQQLEVITKAVGLTTVISLLQVFITHWFKLMFPRC